MKGFERKLKVAYEWLSVNIDNGGPLTYIQIHNTLEQVFINSMPRQLFVPKYGQIFPVP